MKKKFKNVYAALKWCRETFVDSVVQYRVYQRILAQKALTGDYEYVV